MTKLWSLGLFAVLACLVAASDLGAWVAWLCSPILLEPRRGNGECRNESIRALIMYPGVPRSILAFPVALEQANAGNASVIAYRHQMHQNSARESEAGPVTDLKPT